MKKSYALSVRMDAFEVELTNTLALSEALTPTAVVRRALRAYARKNLTETQWTAAAFPKSGKKSGKESGDA